MESVLSVEETPRLLRSQRTSALDWLKVIAVWGGAVVIILLLAFGELSREAIGVLGILLMLLLMLGSVHVGLAMVGAGLLGLYSLGGWSAASATLLNSVYNPTATWQLSVIPTFILMGTALWKSGLTQRAFDSAKLWLGNVPGGLALTTTVSGAGLAASSGSTIALAHSLGRVAVPEMLRAGYRPGFAIGATAMAGTLGQIIPPSVLLVVYAGAAQTSVGTQLMAGIVPGLLLALAFCLFIYVVALFKPGVASRTGREVSWACKFKSLIGVIPLAVVAVIVVAGIASGLFTPTESAALGALVSIILGWYMRPNEPKTLKSFGHYCVDVIAISVMGSAGIFLMLIGVHALTRVVTLSRIANGLTDQILGWGLSATAFMLVLVVLYLVLGMFMDTMAVILLTVPILVSPLTELGVDLVWFGVFVVIMVEIGMVTPPMGILGFVLHRIAQDPEVNRGQGISLTTVFAGVMPFVGVALLFVVFLIFVPDLVTWLPSQLVGLK